MSPDRGPSPGFLSLADEPAAALAARMRRGHPVSATALDGYEFRGLNTARRLELAGADRFVKGFMRGRGYNRRVRRGRRTDPWLPPGQPDPPPFAPFTVGPVDAASRDNRYLQALLLDYGALARGPLDPAGKIRDYLVGIDDDLLLGHAFIALGPFRAPVTFSVLERLRPAPAPPAPA